MEEYTISLNKVFEFNYNSDYHDCTKLKAKTINSILPNGYKAVILFPIKVKTNSDIIYPVVSNKSKCTFNFTPKIVGDWNIQIIDKEEIVKQITLKVLD
jgi:isopentenyl phosphate kinase